MFSRTLCDRLSLLPPLPQYAEDLFRLTDRNREHLRRWLPWVDHTTTPEHSRKFLTDQSQRLIAGRALCVLIQWDGALVGVAGYHAFDPDNPSGSLGYWLAQSATGQGIVTRVVDDLRTVGCHSHGLQRIEIRCASGNQRSRAVPERLGFRHEGTLRRALKLHDGLHDVELYAWTRESAE